MEKEPLPPSYNEVFPSAPPDFHHHQGGSSTTGPVGWNPHMHSQMPPQYTPPQMQQPLMQQPVMMQHQQPPVTQVIVINQQMRFGPNPVSMICPHCREQTISKVSYESNIFNHIAAMACCMVGCFWGCCLIPYCINGLKNVRHDCNRCGTFLGIYRYGHRAG